MLPVKQVPVHTGAQVDDLFHRAPIAGLDDVGGGAVQNTDFQLGEQHPVQGAGIGGAVDGLRLLSQLAHGVHHRAHQGRFAGSRPAFDDVGLPAVAGVIQIIQITDEADRRVGAEVELDRRVIFKHGLPSCKRYCLSHGIPPDGHWCGFSYHSGE